MADLKGKSVIVTGASSGIGEATAIFFAKKGSSVTLNGRDSNRLQDALAKCKAAASEAGHTDNRFLGVLGDITDSAVRDDLVEQTAKTFGKIDVLVVNHAVVIKDDTFDGVTEEGFDETINVNVKSALFLVKRAVPELERNRGCVVCVSSIASQCTSKQGFFSYTISKAAMDHMARCLALELGPKGIRVNCTNPTFVRTRIFRDIMPDPALIDATEEIFAKATPLKGPESGTQEQAEVIGFLASDAARFISGQCVVVDGALLRRGIPFNYIDQMAR
ncbi:hypothetical protein RRG08_025742 [Elysia crispata]|uniref:Uncharacterized protein n=1 Tax=Elysia crispata TaxID=231223 RepID=A0AAE1AGN6_9GAST|nr:hypothetical protein RRG08_025742 [Elysia crispata]